MSGTSMAYGVLCLLSMMLAAGCYYRTTYREFRLQLVFVAVLAVNTGYFMLSISKTLEGALMANSLAYLGSAALQPAMLLTIMDMCKVRLKREKLFPFPTPHACTIKKSYMTTRTDFIGRTFDWIYTHMNYRIGYFLMKVKFLLK